MIWIVYRYRFVGYCGKIVVRGGPNEFYELIGRSFVFFICDSKKSDFQRKRPPRHFLIWSEKVPKATTKNVWACSILTLWAKYDMTLQDIGSHATLEHLEI
jgi:hypothetical protein